MCTISFMLPLIIQLSPNHTVTLIVTVEARRFKPYMSQLETLGGANQLSYKAFGQLQIKYILELSNTLVPKSFSLTSIFFFCILQYIIDCVLTTVHIHSNFFKRERWTRARTSSPVTICLNKVCSKLVQLVNTLTALKLIHLYVKVYEKRKPKDTFTDPKKIVLEF